MGCFKSEVAHTEPITTDRAHVKRRRGVCVCVCRGWAWERWRSPCGVVPLSSFLHTGNAKWTKLGQISSDGRNPTGRVYAEEEERGREGEGARGAERRGGKKNKLANTPRKTTNGAALSRDADVPPLLSTLSLVALTLEPLPTPIKHLKAFMFPVPQINNIQHPPPTPHPTDYDRGKIFDLRWGSGGVGALYHLATFISTRGGNEPRWGDGW